MPQLFLKLKWNFRVIFTLVHIKHNERDIKISVKQFGHISVCPYYSAHKAGNILGRRRGI